MNFDDSQKVLEHMCRACMSKSKKFHSLSDKVKGQELTFYEIFNLAVPQVPIYSNDELPKQICVPCVNKLTTVHKFHQMCIASDTHMRSLLVSCGLTSTSSFVEQEESKHQIMKEGPANPPVTPGPIEIEKDNSIPLNNLDDLIEVRNENDADKIELSDGDKSMKESHEVTANEKTECSNNASNESFISDSVSSCVIAKKIESGDLTLSDVKGRSKVWQVFAKIIESDGAPIKKFVCCRHCKKVMRHCNYTTSNLMKHKCYVQMINSESNFVEQGESNQQIMQQEPINPANPPMTPVEIEQDDSVQLHNLECPADQIKVRNESDDVKMEWSDGDENMEEYKYETSINEETECSNDVNLGFADNANTKGLNESFVNDPWEIAKKIESGELTLSDVKGRSKVWQLFAKIIDADGAPDKHLVSCRKCKKILKHSNYTTSNLMRHKCYAQMIKSESTPKIEIDEESKKNIIKVLTQWVVKNCRTYNLVNDDGFKAVLEEFVFIGAKYSAHVDIEKSLPLPSTISRNVTFAYEACLSRIKEELASIELNGFGLTADIWTDDYLKRNYISLTVHFAKEGVLSVRLLGLKSIKSKGCISENISKKVEKLLINFGCNFSKKNVIVTDRGVNMFKDFQNLQPLACISHLLNDTLQKSIEEVAEVAELIMQSAKLVKYIKKSVLNSILSTSLQSYCPTRWNTTFYMLSSIEKAWGEINQLLKSKNQLSRIDSININHLKAVTKMLEPFEEASKHLENWNYATLYLVPMYLHQLKADCAQDSFDLDFMKAFKEKLLFYLDALVRPHVTIWHQIALFLYPPTNKLLQFSDIEKDCIYDECVRLLKDLPSDRHAVQEEVAASSSSRSKYRKLFSGFVQEPTHRSLEDMIAQEMQIYKNTNVKHSDNFNVFNWWELQKLNFPFLYKLSCSLLAVPATSTSSKRVSSAAKNLMCEERTSLSFNDHAVEQILFTHFNAQKHLT